MPRDVLCVMAHPDDEVLGCGATLAKHAAAGDRVQAVCMSRAPTHHNQYKAAMKCIGATHWSIRKFDDQSLDTEPLTKSVGYVVEMVEVRRDFDPDVIYTHSPNDLNLDHELTARAVLTAFRPKPGTKPRTILACEVLSSTEWSHGRPPFRPTWYENVEGYVDQKIEALLCYPTEVQPYPHPRSRGGILNLAAVRGSESGHTYAEAFELIRRC